MRIQNPAHALLHEMMSAGTVKRIDAALEEGRAWWRRDPQYRNTYALFTQDRAVVIVYVDDEDFEVADDFEEAL